MICGGLTSSIVTGVVFPMETVKKRLQAADGTQRRLLNEVSILLREGGARRFYRGLNVKLSTNFAEGALFNVVFVACSKSIEALSNTNDIPRSNRLAHPAQAAQ